LEDVIKSPSPPALSLVGERGLTQFLLPGREKVRMRGA